MLFQVVSLLCLLLLSIGSAEEQMRFDGYQVLRAKVATEKQFQALQSLMGENIFDFWTLPSMQAPVDIMSSPQKLSLLKNFLEDNEISYQVKMGNVQSVIEESRGSGRITAFNKDDAPYELTWDEYYKTDVILEYMDYLAANYDFVSTEVLNTTFEGRPITALKIEKAGEGSKNVYMDGTFHAREWISPAVVTYLIRELVENHESHHYTDNLNFYIIPVVNPDGYDYSHDLNRLWRKTRTSQYSTVCLGVDLNRNFPFQHATGGSGAGDNPCSDDFWAPQPLSEPGSLAVAQLFKSVQPVPELALSYHSAVNSILSPYGYSFSILPENNDELLEVCEKAVAALNAVDDQTFYCARASSLYTAGGNALDWFHEEGSRLSYFVELRENGYGFLLPPKYILPSGMENWAALKVFMDNLLEQ